MYGDAQIDTRIKSTMDTSSRTSHREKTMKISFQKQMILAVASGLALGFASGAAQAQRAPDPLPGNASQDEQRQTWTELRNQVWLNNYGQCWRNNYGPPPGVGECSPAPIAQVVAPIPPAPVVRPAPVVQPAPAPAPVVEPAPLPPRRDRN
jgi:hypothetical protein